MDDQFNRSAEEYAKEVIWASTSAILWLEKDQPMLALEKAMDAQTLANSLQESIKGRLLLT